MIEVYTVQMKDKTKKPKIEDNTIIRETDQDKLINGKCINATRLLVSTYLDNKENILQTAKDLDRPINTCLTSLQSPQGSKLLQVERSKREIPDYEVSKSKRLQFLWRLAEGGAERIYDREGNHVMANPAVSISAVRAINDMTTGSYAPKEVEVTVKDDTRTEAEIRANITKLTEQYNSLAVIEGVTEKEIKAVSRLPA